MDIFPLGCVFAYTLTGGKHPFGDDPEDRPNRIRKKKAHKLVQEDFKEPYSNDNDKAIRLIKSLLDTNPRKRPIAEDVLNDIFSNQEEIGKV